MKKYRCTVCGFINDNEAPDICPKCGAPKEKFEAVPDDQVKLIDRARYTNLLHNDLIVSLEEIMDISLEGMEDNLDPGCLDIFTKAHKAAIDLIQMSKAELQAHVNKGKWG
ncbi:MAG: rubredoxin-like domain-containing protein [Candidatus Margulisiibacteriota bacterium]